MEENKWQIETHGLELTMVPRYTMTLIRRLPRKINPWYNIEAAIDAALGHRYPCMNSGLCREKVPGSSGMKLRSYATQGRILSEIDQ